MRPRLIAAILIGRVRHGHSLARELPRQLASLAERERATVQALTFGCLRQFERIEAVLGQLLQKPFKPKDELVGDLMRVALFELLDAASPDYAVVDAAVTEAKALRAWSAGLVNACLRRFIRERVELLARVQATPAVRYGVPDWLLTQLRRHYPDDWERVTRAFSEPAALTLRVNLARCDRAEYLSLLAAAGIAAEGVAEVPSAITLAGSVEVTRLPQYAEGWIYVQDAGSQLAAGLLAPKPGERVLDACAAPGGKTTHLLECVDGAIDLLALESDPARLGRLEENLARAAYTARVLLADAGAPATWWDGQPFDRILLDAPCSATGVIRRHPDIKLLRREQDLATLAYEQARLLDALWETLRPGGSFIYTTCSILPAENARQINAFLERQGDAEGRLIDAEWGRPAGSGRQILPGESGMDGFFYAILDKKRE
ncbi:MAG: 16S rRNA (cytosine(967)-C(5))-methyltransferase RsmB [Thiotrichales bacterium]